MQLVDRITLNIKQIGILEQISAPLAYDECHEREVGGAARGLEHELNASGRLAMTYTT
jgi:hypothetical protein